MMSKISRKKTLYRFSTTFYRKVHQKLSLTNSELANRNCVLKKSNFELYNKSIVTENKNLNSVGENGIFNNILDPSVMSDFVEDDYVDGIEEESEKYDNFKKVIGFQTSLRKWQSIKKFLNFSKFLSKIASQLLPLNASMLSGQNNTFSFTQVPGTAVI